MLVQYEGPIVDSIWDTFIISWHKGMDPPPPCLDEPAASKPEPTFAQESFRKLFDAKGDFRVPENESKPESLPPHVAGDPHFDPDIAAEIARMRSMLSPTSPGQAWQEIVANHLSMSVVKLFYRSSWLTHQFRRLPHEA